MVAHAINIDEAASILKVLDSPEPYDMALFQRIQTLDQENPKASYWLQDQLSPALLAALSYGRWFLVHEVDEICMGCLDKTVENTLGIVAGMIESEPDKLEILSFSSPSVEVSFQILIDTVCESLLHAQYIRDEGTITCGTS